MSGADLFKLNFILKGKHDTEIEINQVIKNKVSVLPLYNPTINQWNRIFF